MRLGSGEGTRERIVESAVRLFAQHGFTATSVQDIVVDAGVTKGAFYHHFDSKDGVLLHIYAATESDFFTRASAAAGDASSATEAITAIITETVVTVQRYRPYAAIWLGELRIQQNADLAEESRAQALSYSEQAIQLVVDYLEKGITAGEFHGVDDVRAVALTLMAAPVLVYAWLDKESVIAPETTGRMFSELFLDGLRSGARGSAAKPSRRRRAATVPHSS